MTTVDVAQRGSYDGGGGAAGMVRSSLIIIIMF